MVARLRLQLTLRLLVLLSEFLDDLSLFLNFLLQTVVLSFFSHHFFLGLLTLFDQGLLPFSLLLELELKLSLLLSFLFLSLFEGFTSFDQLGFHALHELFELVHLLLLLGSLLLLGLLFTLWDYFDILSLLL